MKIMIVDDHADMRRMMRNVVSMSAGSAVEIVECGDGEEAVDRYDAELPDHVLMDVQLGDMNGFTATERIHAKHPEASVIFVTSHNTSAYRTKAKLLNATGFISKENLSELDTLLHT